MSYQKDNGTTVGVQDVGESILLEAQRLTHGDRNKDYGHPLDDYSKNAGAINALFKHKLREDFTAADVALIMVVVKLSRQVNRPKRDNMVDAAGYAWVANACIEEKTRREEMAAIRTNALCDDLVRSVNRVETATSKGRFCSVCYGTTQHELGCHAAPSVLDSPPPAGADGLARALYQTAQAAASATLRRDDSPMQSRPVGQALCVDEPAPRALPSEKPLRR